VTFVKIYLYYLVLGKVMNRAQLDAEVMEAITKVPAFSDRKPRKTVTCICPIVKKIQGHATPEPWGSQ
jgi:hypothetical protein